MDDINGNTKEKKWYEGYIGILAVITLFAVAFFGLAILANNCWNFGIAYDPVVLAFVGILATFVVVSNYIQVKDIQRDFDMKIDKLNKLVEGKIKLFKTKEEAKDYSSQNNDVLCLYPE